MSEKNPLDDIKSSDDEWLQIWEKYLQTPKEDPFGRWIVEVDLGKRQAPEVFTTIRNALKRLKKIAPEMYEKFMTRERMHWMFFLLTAYGLSYASPELQEKVLQWLKTLPVGEVDESDLWQVFRRNYGKWEDTDMTVCTGMAIFPRGEPERILRYMKSWRTCYDRPIRVDMSDVFRAEFIFRLINVTDDLYHLHKVSRPLRNMKELLSVVERFDRQAPTHYIRPFTEACMNEGNKEVLREAMKKNLVTERMAQIAIDRVRETDRYYDQMPLWIMKLHGQI